MSEARFQSFFSQSMDARGRVAIPAKFIPVLRELAGISEKSEETPLEVIIAPTIDGTLGVFPVPVWNEILAYWESGPDDDLEGQAIAQKLRRYMDPVVLDGQNRARILPKLAKTYHLSGDVVVQGAGKFMEIVPDSEWDNGLEDFKQSFGAAARASREHRRSHPA